MQHNKVATALVDVVDSLGVSPGAEIVRVASLYETANSQPCHKAVSKTSRKMKALGKLQLGVRQEATGGGGNSMSLKLPELCAIQSACFYQ